MGWEQVVLPFSLGGAGLRSAEMHASSAYLASVSRAAHLDDWAADSAEGWDEALVDFCTRAGISSTDLQFPLPSQKSLSKMIDERAFASLLSKVSLRDQVRLSSVRARGDSSWLCYPVQGPSSSFRPERVLSASTLLDWSKALSGGIGLALLWSKDGRLRLPCPHLSQGWEFGGSSCT